MIVLHILRNFGGMWQAVSSLNKNMMVKHFLYLYCFPRVYQNGFGLGFFSVIDRNVFEMTKKIHFSHFNQKV